MRPASPAPWWRRKPTGSRVTASPRVPSYAAQAQAGKVDGLAVPAIERPRPGAAMIDAQNGFAYPALDAAVALLPEMARAAGIACAAIRRSHHCGAAGHPVERLAEQGLVAMMFANTPAAIAPWGGATPVFGTNPIAFACPLPGRPPVVIDLALSKVARGNILAAKQKRRTHSARLGTRCRGPSRPPIRTPRSPARCFPWATPRARRSP